MGTPLYQVEQSTTLNRTLLYYYSLPAAPVKDVRAKPGIPRPPASVPRYFQWHYFSLFFSFLFGCYSWNIVKEAMRNGTQHKQLRYTHAGPHTQTCSYARTALPSDQRGLLREAHRSTSQRN